MKEETAHRSQILRRKDVERSVGLSRSTIYSRIADGTFPAPIPLGERAVGWRASDIDDWIEQQAKRVWPRRHDAVTPHAAGRALSESPQLVTPRGHCEAIAPDGGAHNE